MYVRRKIRWSVIFAFSWHMVIFYAAYSSLIVFVFHYLEHKEINIAFPFLPMSVIGIAVAFYVGFKNSQSYERFWEGRKIWGGIVNSSRTWAVQCLTYVSNLHATEKASDEELKEIKTRLIYRHIAWINALRIHLRKPSRFTIEKKGHVKTFHDTLHAAYHEAIDCFIIKDDLSSLLAYKNIPAQLLRKQGEEIQQLVDRGLVDDFRHMEFMHLIETLYEHQGKSERIKNTPFPRQYSYFSRLFMWIFILLLPLGLVGEFSQMGHGFTWLAIPFYILISWIFSTMESVGEYSEDPFDGHMNDVPMTALCRTIEIDLREMLGETNIPEPLEPVQDVLL
ncbi:MAG: hypothetical protein KDC12_03560 [Flavobacteriales bacterium]|nr:hypothetical protein [Flavobacteriales bacterium]